MVIEPRPGYDPPEPNGVYRFELRGRFKPYVRMTQRSKWIDAQAISYLASKGRLRLDMQSQFLMQRGKMIPRKTPIEVRIIIENVDGWHNRDLDNEIKALLDAMQGVVFEDDRWVDVIEARRVEGPETITRMEVQAV